MNKTTAALKLAKEALIKTMSVLEQAMKLIETPLGDDEWRDGRGAWGDANKALAFIREVLAYHSYTDPIKSNVSVDKAYLRGLRAGYSLGQMESEVDLENPIQGVSSVEQRFRARVASYEKSIKEAEAAIREALAEPVKQEPVAVISESAIGLVKLHSNGACLPFGTQLYAAPVSVEAAVLAEREACANLMFNLDLCGEEGKAAAAIRARAS